MERFSDQQIDKEIQHWLCSSEGSRLTEDIPVILNTVSGLVADLEIGEHSFKLSFSSDLGTAFEISATSHNQKVINFLEDVNMQLATGELRKMPQVMKKLIESYQNTIVNGMEMDGGDGGGWGNDDGDQPMTDDWGLDEGGDICEQYIADIQASVQQDKINEARAMGVSDGSLLSNIFNPKSIRLFEKTKFFQEILEAQEYLQKEESKIKGWLNIVMLKEFLTLRVEIDLNYIDLHPSNIILLGWKIEEPLIIVLDVSEVKILNTLDDEFEGLNFSNMWRQGMLQFSCLNANSAESFGCKDYIRRCFSNFIEQVLQSEDEEEYKLQPQNTNIKLKKAHSSHVTSGGFLSRFFGTTKVDDEALARLIDMGYDSKQASRNLKKANNDIDKALDFITEEILNESIGAGDKEAVNFGVTFSSKQVTPTNNKIIKMMLFISDSLEQATRSCFLCGQLLDADSMKLKTCKKEHCEFTFEEMFMGTLFAEFQFSANEAALDMGLSAKALFSDRAKQVFEPFPSYFLKKSEMRKREGNLAEIKQAQLAGKDVNTARKCDLENKNIKEMIDIFSKIPNPVNLMKDIINEEQLKEKIYQLYKTEKEGLLAYKLLTYIFATNRSKVKLLGPDELVIKSDMFDKQYVFFPHDSSKERKFQLSKKNHKSIFCWHGSSLENWYSIMRNGLRNLSNTSMMTAGAAYGAGIYASSQFGTSWGYTARYTGGGRSWVNCPAFLQNQYVIAIVEIIEKPGYSKQADHNIVVVPDEDDIVIRYLFVIKGGQGYPAAGDLVSTKIPFAEHYQKQMQTLNKLRGIERGERVAKAYEKYKERKEKQIADMKRIQEQAFEKIQKADEEELEKQFQEMSKKLTGKGSAISTQRISKDYAGLMKSTEFQKKLEVEFFNNNMYIWRVYFDLLNYEVSKSLKADFQELEKKMGSKKKSMLQYEVIFPDSYPHQPPFVRVVFPRFAYRTGHVTVGGSICIESLTPSGWSSARSLESYFVEVISLINAGDARLDLHNLMPYSLQEAKDAFNRVAKDHGWIK